MLVKDVEGAKQTFTHAHTRISKYPHKHTYKYTIQAHTHRQTHTHAHTPSNKQTQGRSPAFANDERPNNLIGKPRTFADLVSQEVVESPSH